MNQQENNPTGREVWLDWLRVTACFMVMMVHSAEPFYLGGEGSLVLTKAEGLWAAFWDCIVRPCVPLFVVASAYLQFPLHYSTGEFFRRRAVRILIPFVFWSLVYAFVWGEPVSNLKDLLLNFNYAAGHLWFVYMLLGLYLLMPLLSPWARSVGRKELRAYLGIWLLTTFIPLLRDWLSGGELAMTYGPSGIPRQALYPLWGEASWNSYGTFYYFSGFIGYLLLGLYLRKFPPQWSRRRFFWTGLGCYLAGFAITFGGFLRRLWTSADGVFPVEGPVSLAVEWETTWCFDTVGLVLMTLGVLLMFRNISVQGAFYQKVLLPVSKASYGMYLMHMLALVLFSGWLRGALGTGTDGMLGHWTAGVAIPLTAICTFACVALFSVLLQRIPKVGRWIIG